MNLQDFCWNWFKQSGHPAAYIGFLQSSEASSAASDSTGSFNKKDNDQV